ncbi:MAG: hypothetical protein KDC37_04950 [Flavobacteriales bacterium]|nr:hypothetical protein [Flavobacteriales bacterium]
MFKVDNIKWIIWIFLFPYVTFAQDAHYWSQQYGSRSALCGGLVVGGARDNSAVYYNPGALAFVDSTSLSVNATAYRYDMIDIKNGAGLNHDLKSREVHIVPLMISGNYRLGKSQRHVFGYAVLSKILTGLRFTARNDMPLDVISNNNSPGLEDFVGQLNIKAKLSEQWFGGTYSYKAYDFLSFGVSVFGALRSQSLERSYVARVTPDPYEDYSLFVAQFVAYNDVQSVEYTHLRGILKFGASFDFEKVKFGVTVTAPGISLFGTGLHQRDMQSAMINLTGADYQEYIDDNMTYIDFVVGSDDFRFNELLTGTANDRQSTENDELSVNFKSPLSVAARAEVKLGKTTIYSSVEWFQGIKEYDILLPTDREVVRPRSDKYGWSALSFLGIRHEALSVFNYGFGVSVPLYKNYTAFSSYRSDISYKPDKAPSIGGDISLLNWNISHVTAGLMVNKKRSDISIGLDVGFSNTQTEQLINIAEPSESLYLQGALQKTTGSFLSAAFILGYTYHFRN